MANDEILPMDPYDYIPYALDSFERGERTIIYEDIGKYIHDKLKNSNADLPVKPYLERLRLIFIHRPSNTHFLNIFKSFIPLDNVDQTIVKTEME